MPYSLLQHACCKTAVSLSFLMESGHKCYVTYYPTKYIILLRTSCMYWWKTTLWPKWSNNIVLSMWMSISGRYYTRVCLQEKKTAQTQNVNAFASFYYELVSSKNLDWSGLNKIECKGLGGKGFQPLVRNPKKPRKSPENGMNKKGKVLHVELSSERLCWFMSTTYVPQFEWGYSPPKSLSAVKLGFAGVRRQRELHTA